MGLASTYPYEHCKQVQEFTAPIFRELGLNFFSFTRVFPDGKQIILSQSSNCIRDFFEKNLHTKQKVRYHPSSYENAYALWDKWHSAETLHNLKETHNTAHGLTILKKLSKDSFDIFHFGLPANKPKNEKLLLNLNAFELFIMNFRSKAIKLIDTHKKKFFFSNESSKEVKPEAQSDWLFEKRNIYPELSDLNHFVLLDGDKAIKFTKMQSYCIWLMANYMTCKNMSQKANVSANAIEKHLQAIKLKLNCHHKSEIISKINKLDNSFLKNLELVFQTTPNMSHSG